MSQTVKQIYDINPVTTLAATDLFYLVQSPYSPGTDAAIAYSSFGVSTATASQVARLDANANLNALNFNPGFTTAAATGSDVFLTVASTYIQVFTGNPGIGTVVRMPDVTTLQLGQSWKIFNNTAQSLNITTVNGTSILSLDIGTAVEISCAAITGTTSASWVWMNIFQNGGVGSLKGTNNQVLVNGLSGSYLNGQLTLTTPQDIATNSNVVFNTVTIGNGNYQLGATNLTAQDVDMVLETTGIFGSKTITLSGTAATFTTPLVLSNQLTVQYGGTGKTSTTAYALLAGGTTSTGALQSLATGTSGQILTSGGASALPAWSTATFPTTAGTAGTMLRANGTNWVASTSTFADTYSASTLLYSNGANTVTGLATANSAMLFTNSSGVPAWTGSATNGQLLIGSTGASPALAALTAGTNITITNAAAGITIAATGSLATATISGTTQTAAVNTRYIALNSSQTNVTLPSTYAVGDMVSVVGATANTGGFVVTAASGDTIRVINTTTSTGGTVTSPATAGQAIALICDVANTSWVAYNYSVNGVFTTT